MLDSDDFSRYGVGFFGKLPSHADFVGAGLPPAFVAFWDDWLRHGLTAESVATRAWTTRVREAGCTPRVQCFVIGAGICSGGAWVGATRASMDSVGRFFPITVAMPVTPALAARVLARTLAFTLPSGRARASNAFHAPYGDTSPSLALQTCADAIASALHARLPIGASALAGTVRGIGSTGGTGTVGIVGDMAGIGVSNGRPVPSVDLIARLTMLCAAPPAAALTVRRRTLPEPLPDRQTWWWDGPAAPDAAGVPLTGIAGMPPSAQILRALLPV